MAGRIRPKTIASGILMTKRSRPVSTSMLTRMLVPKPKNAFQSPGVQSAGLLAVIVSPPSPSPCLCRGGQDARQKLTRPRQGGGRAPPVGGPTRGPAADSDDRRPCLVELREREAALGGHGSRRGEARADTSGPEEVPPRVGDDERGASQVEREQARSRV